MTNELKEYMDTLTTEQSEFSITVAIIDRLTEKGITATKEQVQEIHDFITEDDNFYNMLISYIDKAYFDLYQVNQKDD